MTIIQLLIVALVGEAVWETCKMFYQKGKVSCDRIGAAVVGLLIAFGAQMDIFSLVGISLVIPYLGYVLTGLLISRGANVIHDLWSAMTGVAARGKLLKATAGDKIIIPASRENLSIDIKPKAKKKGKTDKAVAKVVASDSSPSIASAGVDALKKVSSKLSSGAAKVIGTMRRTPDGIVADEVEQEAPPIADKPVSNVDSPDFEDHVKVLEPEAGAETESEEQPS